MIQLNFDIKIWENAEYGLFYVYRMLRYIEQGLLIAILLINNPASLGGCRQSYNFHIAKSPLG